MTDPVALAAELIRCPSVTPDDAGAMTVVESWLTRLGFACQRLDFNGIANLYARRGSAGPNFCFAGHTDVVPAGDGWTVDPFGAEIHNGRLYGRGACDMKGGVAAFVAAVARFLETEMPKGSISLLITGDEEGRAVDGTVKVLRALADRGETLDACIVGEPTNPGQIGEMMKVGRRGSLNCAVEVRGTQGHVAYPHLADNPIPVLLQILAELTAKPLDQGSEFFQPSSLVLTTVDVGNSATNVIPARARAGFNIRFNDLHSGASLSEWIKTVLAPYGDRVTHKIEISGESFVTPTGPLSDAVAAAVQEVTGLTPEPSTSGGTSDARFIARYCPVVEFGLNNQTMHKTDEHVALSDLETLTRIYQAVLARMV